MAIFENEVNVSLNSTNIEYYENKGYEIPRYLYRGQLKVKRGTTILVKIEDLSKGCNSRVTKICDICGGETPNLMYASVLAKRGKDGLDRCLKCGSKHGANKRVEESINDINCLSTTHPHVAKLLYNPELGKNLTYGSGKKVYFKCQDCGNKVKKQIHKVSSRGVSCPRCGDGYSYPEKFVYNVLLQLNMDFEFQKSFDEWYESDDMKYYDFYLPSMNCIIEVHGLQHYKESFSKIGNDARNLEEETLNDETKRKVALAHGVNEGMYISLDARYSEYDYIKNSIINSRLGKLFDLSKINWVECSEFATSSIIKQVCERYNGGLKNTAELGDVFKINRATVISYLHKGSKIGFCNYKGMKDMCKAIVQLTKNGEFVSEFESATDAQEKTGISLKNISQVCHKEKDTAKGFRWMFASEYYELTNGKRIKIEFKKKISKRIKRVCQLDEEMNIIKVFESVTTASEITGTNLSSLSSCCRGVYKTAGGYKWMYEEDCVNSKKYLKQI
ncbi:zinc-ribbon domain-containing protein [Peribacillus asahii]|uniref:zinc-ribbon domain-containing protein n=1 Tax=Peribacillus asahii TaxID=228899 RepID=UPI00381CCBB2